MRVIGQLIFFVGALAVLAIGSFFIAREVLLQMAVSQIRSSATTMRRIAANTSPYIQQCRNTGVSEDAEFVIDSIQLRFDSPTTYILEIVCSQFTLNPIEIERKILPRFVTKTVGSSGLIYGDVETGIGLEIWGRSRGVFTQERIISSGPAERSYGLPGPVTSCSGHGYSCCQSEVSQGVGSTMSNVTDCPRSCYETCLARPLVLSLTTQPYFDPVSRVLSVSQNTPIEFAYVLDPQGTQNLAVTLSFGDGQQQSFAEFQGQVTHQYACMQSRCEYTVTLTAENQNGVSSAVTPISQLKVIVTQ